MTQLTKIIILLVATQALAAPLVNRPEARQLAGEGNLLDSLFTDTDNGIGYGIENAEDNLTTLLGGTPSRGGGSTTGGGNGGNAAPPPPPGPRFRVKRQGDKIANGAAGVLNALGATKVADLVQTDGDNIDGQLTDDATTIGEQFGGDEEDVLERLGDMVPSKLPTTGGAPATGGLGGALGGK